MGDYTLFNRSIECLTGGIVVGVLCEISGRNPHALNIPLIGYTRAFRMNNTPEPRIFKKNPLQ
jgi:hypothetical protein